MRPDEKIYNNSKWQKRRKECKHRRDWYEGKPLLELLDEKNRDTNELLRMFPLGINLLELGVDLHADLARGNMSHDEKLVITTKVERGDDPRMAEHLEQVINEGVWAPSRGGTMQREALLFSNVYDGTVFQIVWEPWNEDLPYRLAVRHIKDASWLWPVAYNPRDPWRLLECYIGYEITPEVAKTKYGVTARDTNKPVLYMEHWTEKEWKITVDGRVPVMKWDDKEMELQGENPWGFVPVYYIPHDRRVSFYGKSHVDGTEDVVKEFNSRATTVSDLMHGTRPGMLWGTDITHAPQAVVVRDENGNPVAKIFSLGKTRTVPGAQPPKVFPTPTEKLPDSLLNYPQTLREYWMMIARVSPASLGLDDTQSGRITGTAVANRMWTSVSHATTERQYFNDGKTMMDGDILRMLKILERDGWYRELGLEPPDVLDAPRYPQIHQKWSSMLLMDRTEEHQMLVDAKAQDAISLHRFVAESGVEDVDDEVAKIREQLEFEAELEAKVAEVQARVRREQNNDQQTGSSGSSGSRKE